MTTAIVLTAVLLLVGLLLRVAIPLFRWLYVPASVIAGGVGLLAVSWAQDREQPLARLVSTAAERWQDWPGVLIAVVFAGMLLERQPATVGSSLRRAGREGLMVWIIVLGQTAIGLLATWLVIQPLYQPPVPDAFGMLIETGFAGGHGTAAAMGEVFRTPQVGMEAGLDLGVLMATIGLVYGIVSGVVWVNIGVRRGWTGRSRLQTADQPTAAASLGRAVVRGDLIDPLLIQAVWLAIAFGIGMLLQGCLNAAVQWSFPLPQDRPADPLAGRLEVASVVAGFPLFIYTLFGGWIVRKVAAAVGAAELIDSASVGRLTAASMDILVVAAIATLNLTAVGQRVEEILLLVVVAAIWTAFCLLWLSRRILPRDHWFELGLINYGMSTGTTATGFVLLRMIDPELDSGAAEDYALAAPLSSPFVGGGMITIGLPLVVLGNVPLPVVAIGLSLVVLLLSLLGWAIARQA